MGMYDSIYCSKDLGPGFYKRDLQTKDLQCCMCEYWLDPAGHLFEIDYSNTQDFVEDPNLDTPLWKGMQWIRNGNHGRVKLTNITKIIEVYPTQWDCKYSPYPRLHLYIKDGILVEVIDTTRVDDAPLTEERSY